MDKIKSETLNTFIGFVESVLESENNSNGKELLDFLYLLDSKGSVVVEY